ncbi:oxalurate catabolism protein HpxZ [Acetobacter conturbans]|uniref:Oxalurate catabolism protein HpxZ n=1 Tax=Acetobacter conturbans TaxID=1737472 RepID=A0ABX0JVJ2_9PROT|nr:oxalurate catabolism protein HpxZ [Acetobacter conturbans]NHN87407.1 oxalurate catabolism protein HpxZ [Acetobacter conturbans]
MIFNDEKTIESVTRYSDLYEQALAENDVRALDAFFWDGPEVVRYGVGENLYGSDEIAAFRRARQGGSPSRKVLRRHVTCVDQSMAVVSLEFQRDGSARIGRQMQTWILTDNGWKILAAHVSIMADKPETETPAAL